MLVYRIQDVNGVGPYRKDEVAELYESCRGFGYGWSERRPGPARDPGLGGDDWQAFSLKWRKTCRFGFSSIDQLKEWFNTKKVRHGLHKLGFAVYVINVDDDKVIVGDKQVVFVPEPAPDQHFSTERWSGYDEFDIHRDRINNVISLLDI